MSKRTIMITLAALAVVIGSVVGIVSHAPAAQASTTHSFYVTLYGWPDNSPPGGDIAFPASGGYPTIHDSAGGTGTYSDPITFATDQSELAPGTRVYYPFLHRYFIMEDECTECDQDWSQGKYHIDLWIGGQGGDSNAVINCEDALTQDSADVIIDPPSNESVDTTPLFDSGSNTCYSP